MNDQLADIPDKFYRFRSITNLLGEHKELERLTLYFASPDELNDPIEGYMDLVWEGDEIIWNNLFKHFIYCFHREFAYTLIVSQNTDSTIEPAKFLLDSHPHLIQNTWNDPPYPLFGRLFDDIYEEVQRIVKISEIANQIASMGRRIRRHELKFYLDCLLIPVLDIIIKYALDNVPEAEDIFSLEYTEPGESVLTATNFFEIANTDRDFFTSDRITFFEVLEGQRLRQLYEQQKQLLDPQRKLLQHLLHDFTNAYLDHARHLLWPEWYAVCFSESFSNPVLWSNYADDHKGVCLMFGSEVHNQERHIRLYQTANDLNDGGATESPQPAYSPFKSVMYCNKREEINFFRSMGAVPWGTLRDNWYRDELGNISTCDSHSKPDFDGDEWRKAHWESFRKHYSTKGKVWEYEQEWRLVDDEWSLQINENDNRIYEYHFSALKGLIFGMRTSDEDKIKIIDIIERMRLGAGEAEFNYYQAYYHHGDSNIRAYPVIISSSSAITEGLTSSDST